MSSSLKLLDRCFLFVKNDVAFEMSGWDEVPWDFSCEILLLHVLVWYTGHEGGAMISAFYLQHSSYCLKCPLYSYSIYFRKHCYVGQLLFHTEDSQGVYRNYFTVCWHTTDTCCGNLLIIRFCSIASAKRDCVSN